MIYTLGKKMIYTLGKSSRVSFSRTGEFVRMQDSGSKSGATHQYLLSNKVFNLLNVGQCFKSLVKMNWKENTKVNNQDAYVISLLPIFSNDVDCTTQKGIAYKEVKDNWHTFPVSDINLRCLAFEMPPRSTQPLLQSSLIGTQFIHVVSLAPQKTPDS